MNANIDSKPELSAFADMIRESVFTLLFNLMAEKSGLLGRLDQCSQRRVLDDMMAKTELVLESRDPAEHCYENLIREIDCEAEMGVLLADKAVGPDALERVCEEPGVSGELRHQMERIAPIMFPDEYKHSDCDLDIVWASVQALYDRARLDAEVSEHIMEFFVDTAGSVRDMTDGLRSTFYAFHEDGIRRQCDMSSLLDEHEMRGLAVLVSKLIARASSYEDRIETIRWRQHDVTQIPLC